MRDKLRTVILSPYRAGMGPKFRLETWATDRRDRRGQTVLGYRLSESGPGGQFRDRTDVIFEGEDFAGSPLYADDADETLRSLLGFLTLRPGDTDADYFAAYTDAQREYCEQHAEALGYEADSRFGEG